MFNRRDFIELGTSPASLLTALGSGPPLAADAPTVGLIFPPWSSPIPPRRGRPTTRAACASSATASASTA